MSDSGESVLRKRVTYPLPEPFATEVRNRSPEAYMEEAFKHHVRMQSLELTLAVQIVAGMASNPHEPSPGTQSLDQAQLLVRAAIIQLGMCKEA